ncbi:MAG TPA: S26 family signal peptidase [Candidatus Methanoperedens sp.]
MGIKDKIKYFKESENSWIRSLWDVLIVISIVAILSSVSYIALGRWSPMFAVESESMVPHMQIGDLVLAQSPDRTEIVTYEKGKDTGYKSFEDYGDVILYLKYGKEGDMIIIHRARYYVEKGEPMWPGGPLAPHAGYITKGDNSKTNPLYDQQGSVSFNQPVKREWIIGVARFRQVPLLGYVSLIPRKALNI